MKLISGKERQSNTFEVKKMMMVLINDGADDSDTDTDNDIIGKSELRNVNSFSQSKSFKPNFTTRKAHQWRQILSLN